MTNPFSSVPGAWNGLRLNPAGAQMMAAAQGAMLGNAYIPSIMQSLGFDPSGDAVRSLLGQSPAPHTPTDSQRAEADGDNLLWYRDQFGVPQRSAAPLDPRWASLGMTGRQAAAILRQREQALAPPPAPTQPAPQRSPFSQPMSLSDSWSR